MALSCADIRDAFLSGRPARGEGVAEHVAGCSACRELLKNPQLGTLLASRGPSELSERELLSRVRARIDHEVGFRAWLRSQKTSRRALLVVSAVAVALVPALASNHSKQLGWEHAALSLTVLGVALLVALTLTLTPSFRPARPRAALAVTVLSIGIPFVVASLAGAGAPELAAPPRAVSCFLYGAALSIPTFALVWLSDRAERASLTSSLLLAGACGLVANLILRLHCPSSDPAHLLLGHASIGVAWLLASAAPVALRRD